MHNQFTTRRLTPEKKTNAHILQSLLLWFIAIPCFVIALSYWPYRAVAWVQRELGVIPAQALSFDPELPEVALRLPISKPVAKAAVPAVKGVDLDKLALAVGRHETGNCTAKVGSALYNNCHGFRINGKFLRFKTKAESYAYFKDLWSRRYGRFPDLALARKYSGNDRAEQWLSNVTSFYNAL